MTLNNIRNAVFWYIVYIYAKQSLLRLRMYGVSGSVHRIYKAIAQSVMRFILRTPAARRKIKKQIDQTMKGTAEKMISHDGGIERRVVLPAHGIDRETVMHELETLHDIGEVDWQSGRVSGAIYHGGQDMSDLISKAFSLFVISNPLHPDIWPGVRKMEAEVVRMCLEMYHAPTQPLEGPESSFSDEDNFACGTTTSGGTESILMACKAYRDWAKEEKGITAPEMIVPISSHAAFDKAGYYFGIKVHHAPVHLETRQVQVSAVKRLINANTILIVGSAPNFPDGAVDDIPALGQLARRHSIGLHVDCCLGSFIVPFLEKAGFPYLPFDFRVDGVTSISCDTHKYGFAPKGSSVVMYASGKLRRYQYFIKSDWPGGVYASPSIAGSRPGALVAGTWAAMMHMGEDGYTASCREIVGAAKQIEAGIRLMPDLKILGKPLVSVVAFTVSGKHSNLNIYDVGDFMGSKGWNLNALQDPPALHIACTRLTVPFVGDFVRDLAECIALAKDKPSGHKPGEQAAMYGMAGSVDSSIIGEAAGRYISLLFRA